MGKQMKRAAVPPSAENLVKVRRDVRLLSPLFRLALMPWHRITSEGRENIPAGPVLFLSNHVAKFDPITLILAARRNIHFMATESVMSEPGISKVMQIAGVVPKKKFVADMRSVRSLKAWHELGGSVGLFPEGQRTWDGRGLPLIPGIGKLVRLLNAPVVTCRIVNAYRQHPRWAEKMRRGRVHVQFDPPRTFARRADVAEIEAYLEDRLRVPDGAGGDWTVRGSGLALGVGNVLFSCPSCFHLDALDEQGDRVVCTACGAGWTLDVDLVLTADGSGERVLLADAVDAAWRHFGRSWVADPAQFARDGTILRSEPMRLLDISGDVGVPIATGRLRLSLDGLAVDGSDWRLAMADLRAVTVDMARRLQFRAVDGAFEAELPTESVVKWERIVQHWRARGGG